MLGLLISEIFSKFNDSVILGWASVLGHLLVALQVKLAENVVG